MKAKARRLNAIKRTMRAKPVASTDSPGAGLRRLIDQALIEQARAQAEPTRPEGSSTAPQTHRTDRPPQSS
jgi:hypothetical protein